MLPATKKSSRNRCFELCLAQFAHWGVSFAFLWRAMLRHKAMINYYFSGDLGKRFDNQLSRKSCAHAHTSVDLYPSQLACHDNELTFRMALTRADQTTNTLVASRRNGGCQRKIFVQIGLSSEIPHTISTWCIPEKSSASKASGQNPAPLAFPGQAGNRELSEIFDTLHVSWASAERHHLETLKIARYICIKQEDVLGHELLPAIAYFYLRRRSSQSLSEQDEQAARSETCHGQFFVCTRWKRPPGMRRAPIKDSYGSVLFELLNKRNRRFSETRIMTLPERRDPNFRSCLSTVSAISQSLFFFFFFVGMPLFLHEVSIRALSFDTHGTFVHFFGHFGMAMSLILLRDVEDQSIDTFDEQNLWHLSWSMIRLSFRSRVLAITVHPTHQEWPERADECLRFESACEMDSEMTKTFSSQWEAFGHFC